MKQKKDKTKSIVFSNVESTETLFEKIKGWEVMSQVKFAVSFDNPKRKVLFEMIIEAVSNETVKQNISFIVQRIEKAGFKILGYTPSEIEYYQSIFAKDFYTVLHSENYQMFIEDKTREFHFYCKGLEQDLRTKQYEFLEDREQDKYQLAEAERYKVYLENLLIQLNTPAPQQTEKPKPELNETLISFSSTEIIESLHNELKGYFQGKEAELKRALQGKQLQEFLLFPNNQNKFVEVFKRLKYNGFLLSTPKETKDWVCSTFTYQYQKGNKKEVREFNTSTVHDILTKDKGEPTKKERICIVDWLPYKSHLKRQREAEKESI